MTIPEPWSTILFFNMLIGLIVSTIGGGWFAAWLTEKFVDRLTLTFKVHTFFLRFILHRKEFMEWQARHEMGWTAGSDIMSAIIAEAVREIPDCEARARFYLPLIRRFEDEDCDTLDACLGQDLPFDNTYRTHTALNDNDDSDIEEDGD